jgi:hypothetical protein
MSTDRIARFDAHGDRFEVLTGAALRFELGSTMKESVLVGLMAPNSCMVTFDEEGAVEVALLLLGPVGPEGVGEALAQFLPAVLSDDLPGCGDHSCAVAKPRGMGTNGHCRCDERTLRRALRRERAAKVDIVGAARRVKEARAKVVRLSALAQDDDLDDTDEFRAACDVRDEAVRQWDRLSAELAKLEGGA